MITSHFIELGMAYLLAAMMPGPSVTLLKMEYYTLGQQVYKLV